MAASFRRRRWRWAWPRPGNLYSSVNDQAKFLQFLFAGGKSPTASQVAEEGNARIDVQDPVPREGREVRLRPRLLRQRSRGQARHPPRRRGLRLRTEFAALPDDKLGVIVCASKDVANAVTARIADTAPQARARRDRRGQAAAEAGAFPAARPKAAAAPADAIGSDRSGPPCQDRGRWDEKAAAKSTSATARRGSSRIAAA